MSFVLLKQLVASEAQRKEMMQAKAMQVACRAVKSDKPEVSNYQHRGTLPNSCSAVQPTTDSHTTLYSDLLCSAVVWCAVLTCAAHCVPSVLTGVRQCVGAARCAGTIRD